jgi:hypothetical protein
MIDHKNAQSIFHEGTKERKKTKKQNKAKVASILIQQSVHDTKQVACHERSAR